MPDEVKEEEILEEEHHEEPKKKGLFGKVKAAIIPDADEQAAIISTFAVSYTHLTLPTILRV